MLYLTWIDYVLFAFMLFISALIGVYYGCFGSKQSTTEEYLHGGKSMKIFPIAMSLTASHLSGITLLGLPSEIYMHGTQYWICPISAILLMLLIIYVFLPVFYKLQLVSTYEYLKIRFDHRIRTLASLLFILCTLLYVPIVIYVPALAFNQMTGIELYKICPLICLVCIFYTTIGGLKAVVWTDTLQFSLTVGTMAVVLVMGTYAAGGVQTVWEKADSRDRIEFFNMDPDPTVRTTVWTIVLGMTMTWLFNLGINPSSVQRFLAVPSYSAAKKSVVYFALGTIITKSISCFSGLLVFAKYMDCDPLLAGKIKRTDQLLPYYVLDIGGHVPGLAGLFIAGVFSTALSTMSTSINTLAGTIYTDFIKSKMPVGTTEKTASNIMKIISVVTGLISLVLVFVVEKLGAVLPLSLSLHGITAGPILGLFILGMFFPSANTTGALWGGIGSTALTTALVAGVQYYTIQGKIKHPHKSVSIAGCDFNATALNSTQSNSFGPTANQAEQPFALFLVSFYYFTLIGTVLALIIGLIASWISKKKDEPKVDRDLLTPCIYWMLDEDEKARPAAYATVDDALKRVAEKNEDPVAEPHKTTIEDRGDHT